MNLKEVCEENKKGHRVRRYFFYTSKRTKVFLTVILIKEYTCQSYF